MIFVKIYNKNDPKKRCDPWNHSVFYCATEKKSKDLGGKFSAVRGIVGTAKKGEKHMKHFTLRSVTALAVCLLLLLQTSAAVPERLIPGGNTVGLSLELDGVSVVEFSNDMAQKAGLRCGDLIVEAEDTPISTVEELQDAVRKADGRLLRLTVRRGTEERQVKLAPMDTPQGPKLGILVRDRLMGIGTLTYYNADDGTFGALGHGINNADNGAILPVKEGELLPSKVDSVQKGKEGAPGALQGSLCGQERCGEILQNTPQGIFGTMTPKDSEALPVGRADTVKKGDAEILSNVHGTEVRRYAVQILELYPSDSHDRNLLLRVTDPELLNLTGGIVQGMSGSPIIQDGHLIGAVTHVLIDDPTQGYGIFIENMLDAAG